MYSLKNEKDVSNILKYHRAKDMVNIMKFFPRLSPVEDLAVILDEADYLENKKKIAHLTSIRNGNPVSELCMKSIPTKEINPDCIEVLRKIKTVLIFDLTCSIIIIKWFFVHFFGEKFTF